MLLAFAILAVVHAANATTPAAVQPFKPGELMRDEDGNRIRAHQPHLYRLGNETLWLGASHVGSSDGTPGEINAYLSVDASLRSWRYAGVVYDCNSKPGAQDCYIARPSLLRHPATQEWILWAKGAGKSFQVATLAASATLPLGPFRTAGAYNPSLFTAAGGSQSCNHAEAQNVGPDLPGTCLGPAACLVQQASCEFPAPLPSSARNCCFQHALSMPLSMYTDLSTIRPHVCKDDDGTGHAYMIFSQKPTELPLPQTRELRVYEPARISRTHVQCSNAYTALDTSLVHTYLRVTSPADLCE